MEGSKPNADGSGSPQSPEKAKTWVQFNDSEEPEKPEVEKVNGHSSPKSVDVTPAVIEPTIEIHSPGKKSPAGNHHVVGTLQTVELDNQAASGVTPSTSGVGMSSTLNGGRRNPSGFTNGDVIVSILPLNTRWPWITPASFRPELVPEELMAPGLTLTVEEYVHAMELLTSDVRFNAYTICYKRLLASWLGAAFFILLIILFSGVVGIHLFALGISWLIINAAAVFFCMYLKIKINQGLERCMARVNKMFLKHKLLVGLDDRGRISCHKVHLCFIYFDPNECVKKLDQVLEGSQDRQRLQNQLDAQDVEIVITGAQNTTRIPQKQCEALFLRYSQRWAKTYLRELAILGQDQQPLHCPRYQCPCQFIQDVLQDKRAGLTGCCSICQNISYGLPNSLAM